MSKYMSILLYLKQFEGDGIEYPIEHLFENSTVYEIKSVLDELSESGLITYTGRDSSSVRFNFSLNQLDNTLSFTEDPNEDLIRLVNADGNPLKAKITFKGCQFLKEEIQLRESGKYNFNSSGTNNVNNIILNSPNATINNKSKIIKEIIDAIQNDNSSDYIKKSEAIEFFQNLENEIESSQNKPKSILEKLLTYSSEFSSVGQLIMALLKL